MSLFFKNQSLLCPNEVFNSARITNLIFVLLKANYDWEELGGIACESGENSPLIKFTPVQTILMVYLSLIIRLTRDILPKSRWKSPFSKPLIHWISDLTGRTDKNTVFYIKYE